MSKSMRILCRNLNSSYMRKAENEVALPKALRAYPEPQGRLCHHPFWATLVIRPPLILGSAVVENGSAVVANEYRTHLMI